MEKVLYLERRGCNIPENENVTGLYDLDNHRLVTMIVDNHGRNLFIEFTHGCRYRETNKRTGKPLKKPILENNFRLYVSSQYENMNGSWRDITMERELWMNNFSFTEKDILQAVNLISPDNYTRVIICDQLPHLYYSNAFITNKARDYLKDKIMEKGAYNRMLAAAGYREKDALKNAITYSYNKNDNVVTLYYNPAGSFAGAVRSIEFKTDGRITG